MLFDLLFRDLAICVQCADVGGPFGAKHIGTRQRTITAANDERVDALFDEIVRCSKATLWGAECFGARRSNERSALLHTLRRVVIHYWASYLCKPAPNIVPSRTDDVAPLECASAEMVARTISKEISIAESEVFDEIGRPSAMYTLSDTWISERVVEGR